MGAPRGYIVDLHNSHAPTHLGRTMWIDVAPSESPTAPHDPASPFRSYLSANYHPQVGGHSRFSPRAPPHGLVLPRGSCDTPLLRLLRRSVDFAIGRRAPMAMRQHAIGSGVSWYIRKCGKLPGSPRFEARATP